MQNMPRTTQISIKSLSVALQGVPQWGDPTESPEEVDLQIEKGRFEHSLGGRSKPQFGLLLAFPWLLQGAYCARSATLLGIQYRSTR